MNMKQLRIITLVVVVLCILVVAYGYGQKDKVYPVRGFCSISIESVERDGKLEPRNIRTRFVKYTGEWKEFVQPVSSDKGAMVVASRADGDYAYNNSQGLQLTGSGRSPVHPDTFTTATYRTSPNLLRIDKLLGREAYVLRTDQGDGDYAEEWVVPEFGRMPLKLVLHNHLGGSVTNQAISVEFMDVTDEMLKMPDLPLKFDFLEKRIKQAEQKGDQETAQALRLVINNRARAQ